MDTTAVGSRRLVVIPSDPLDAYAKKGRGPMLRDYFNPSGYFEEVFVVSPLEIGRRHEHGLTIIGAPAHSFRRTLRSLNPDVVRAYGGYWPADFASWFRLPGVPVIVSVHDTSEELFHDSTRYADLVVCTSGAVRDLALRRGIPASRTRILPNRVDLEMFQPRESDDPAIEKINRRFPSGKAILHVGRKAHEKNIDTLIRSLGTLPSDYFCVFIGAGDDKTYRALAKECGVMDRCFWIPSVDNPELPAWYSWCACMCTPSRWEGFGVVFIEAAACAAGIVTTDIAPMNEYLEHAKSAHLVADVEDPEALAAGIRAVCEDADYRNQIGRGARQMAARFRKPEVDSMEVAIYREALEIGPAPRLRRIEQAAFTLRGRVGVAKPAFAAAVRSILPPAVRAAVRHARRMRS